MEERINGFDKSEIMDLYHYLCIYEKFKLGDVNSLNMLWNKYPELKGLEQIITPIICNYCTRESLKVIGVVPMNNLMSMTKCRSSKLLSLMHHLRNSIAHGQIELEDDYIHLIDFGYETEKGSKIKKEVISARGKIKSSILFEMIQLITIKFKKYGENSYD